MCLLRQMQDKLSGNSYPASLSHGLDLSWIRRVSPRHSAETLIALNWNALRRNVGYTKATRLKNRSIK